MPRVKLLFVFCILIAISAGDIHSYEGPLDIDIFSYDRSKFPDSLTVLLTVKDKNGKHVGNIPTEDIIKNFRINAGQDTLFPKDFRFYEVLSGEKVSYSFCLVLDHSYSMAGEPIKYLEEAVYSFMDSKRPNDAISVVKFDSRVTTEVPLTDSFDQIFEKYKFDGLKRFGYETALYAAMGAGIDNLNRTDKTKVMIVFSDGHDNASLKYSLDYDENAVFTAEDAIRKARSENIKVYTVGFGDANKQILGEISNYTDGKNYYAKTSAEIASIYSEFPDLFNSFYRLTFKPFNKTGYHHVEITAQIDSGVTRVYNGKTFVGDEFQIISDALERPAAVAFFQYNSFLLQKQEAKKLDIIANYLKKNDRYEMKIIGHSDMKGTEEGNKVISQRRADVILQEFLRRNIKRDRMEAIGIGFGAPMYKEEDQPWKADMNRRVEVQMFFK